MPGFSSSRLKRLTGAMAAYVGGGQIPGMVGLIARGEETHVEIVGHADLAASAAMRRDSLFRIASVSKPVIAVAAMMLVEEGVLRLDGPVDGFLPELADRRVLSSLEAEVTDTVAAERPITLRDLLTFRFGFGLIPAAPGTYPIQQAQADAGLAAGPLAAEVSPDEWMRRLGALPLMSQPGAVWRYHTAADVLGVLIARASGQDLATFLAERVFAPLGMKDTGFHARPDNIDRLTTAYARDAAGSLQVFDPAAGGQWSRPPPFPSGGGGLVSTADDLLAFGRMMLGQGRLGSERLLSRATVELMTTDQITPAQKAVSPFFPGFWDAQGWGFGMSVATARQGLADTPGRYGWIGGTGTAWYCDPRENVVALFLSQRMMQAANDTAPADDFLTLAYQALDG